ncbi:MAG: hypothetical protein E7445_00435 [Ruminococcaceae bacterium]|nr:hypothetical protein [Oscillospiraceae bacterium]
MDENMKRTIEALQANPAAAQALFQSRDGHRLMEMLTQADQGAALQRAAQNASRGNINEMVQMIRQVMTSPEGAALAKRISDAAQK